MTYNSGMPLMLHTADLHIGDSRNLPKYLDRQRKMLYEITSLCVEREVDVAVYSGDLFDAKYMLPREKDMFLEWLIENDRAAKKHNFDVVMMNGNHDEIEEGYTHLRSHKIMADYGMLDHTVIVEDQPRVVGPFKDNIYVVVVPAKNYRGEELNFTVEALYKKWHVDCEKRDLHPDALYIVAMVHEAIYGAVNETGDYKCKRGPKLDPDLPITYWALGDIHKPWQQIMPNAWYPGSPIQHEFGDLSPERGVLIVDLESPTEPEQVKLEGIIPLITVSHVPDEWPTDAIVRYEGTAEEIVDTIFPDNVVGFKPVIDDTIRAVVDTGGSDFLSDLSEVMVDQSVPEEHQDAVLAEIESAIAVL